MMVGMSYDDAARLIRDERSRRDLGIRELAAMAGVSTNTVQRAMRGVASDVKMRAVLIALGLSTDVLDGLDRSADSAERTPTGTVRARTVTPELVTLLGLPDDVLAGLAPEDLAEIDAEAALVILRTARERRGRTI